MCSLRFWAVLASLAVSIRAFSLSSICVSTDSGSGKISLVSSGKAAQLFIAADDWPGVSRAASDFSADVKRVTGVAPKLNNVTSTTTISSKNGVPIIIGTLGHSSVIDAILSHSNASGQSFAALNGSWESFHAQAISNPLPGVEEAYVVVGSDKRGTIFALYELSEQAGVSPWYWWADVPVRTAKNLFLASTPCSHGVPSVRYRGIFLNDEQPALQNWAKEKFTNNSGGPGAGKSVGGDPTFGASGDPTAPGSGTEPALPFNRFFYTRLFELILRLKGNYLWPAQWSSAFNADDPQNQFLADLYGVVMGTSHEEPMMRSIPVEWDRFGSGPWNFSTNAENITQFWIEGTERAHGFEEIYTVGMRGDGDLPLSETTNIDLLEQIVAVQRGILSQVYNTTDVTSIPQVWTLYNEVQGYYEDGMRVEDDITLVWSDDTWGNIRRFPLADERNRSGGAGVYYHFDDVGNPRDYKWIQTTQLSKTFEQLSLAFNRDAKTVWLVNVGDLKPYEMAIEFFITYGYDVTRWTPTNIDNFTEQWATREFNLPEKAQEIVQIIGNVTRWNARRKPELLNSTTYSLTNYREADNVIAAWDATVASSQAIYDALPSATKPSFFELVHHPVLASANLQKLWITAGKNNLFGSQARLSANDLADQVEELFDNDYDLETQYHSLLDGKWDHIMDQTHIGYVYWQQPMQNTMPLITRVPAKKQALPGPMRIALEGSTGAWPGDNQNDCTQGYNCPPPTLTLDSFNPVQSRWIDIGAGGPNTFTFSVTSNVTWLKTSSSKGTISTSNKEQRLELSVDWAKISGVEVASIILSATAKGQDAVSQQVFFVANKTLVPSGFKGFVEGDGVISFEAAHATRNVSVNGVTWTEIPNYGRTLSGVTPLPALGNGDANFTAGSGPRLEYDFYNFNTLPGSNLSVTVLVSPSLNGYGNDRPLAFATQIDSDSPQTQYFIPISAPGVLPPGWDGVDGFVANSIVSVVSKHTVTPGTHTLKIWMVEPAVVVQKIVIDTGGLRSSYLGPPESVRL